MQLIGMFKIIVSTMKIKLQTPQKADKFTTIFQHLKLLSDYVNINFSDDGIYMQCLDGTHCCLFECKLNSSWFDYYEFDEEKATPQIGVHTPTFYKVINIRQEKQEIDISSEGKEIDTININFAKGEKKFQQIF